MHKKPLPRGTAKPMHHIKDAVVAIVVTMFALSLLFQMIRPYIPFLIIAVVLYLIGFKVYRSAMRR